jgi:hypothetical protein
MIPTLPFLPYMAGLVLPRTPAEAKRFAHDHNAAARRAAQEWDAASQRRSADLDESLRQTKKHVATARTSPSRRGARIDTFDIYRHRNARAALTTDERTKLEEARRRLDEVLGEEPESPAPPPESTTPGARNVVEYYYKRNVGAAR